MKKLLILPMAVLLLAASCSNNSVSKTTPALTDTTLTSTPTPSASASPTPTSKPTPSSTDGGAKTYTTADVAKANSVSNCLTIIEGKVYNLTDWVGKHPGGREAILSICGKDGTQAFTAQHDHAQKQQDILKGYYVGDLKK